MSLFRKSPKSPQEVSKALKDALTALERSDKKAEKVRFELSFSASYNLLWMFYTVFILPLHLFHLQIYGPRFCDFQIY